MALVDKVAQEAGGGIPAVVAHGHENFAGLLSGAGHFRCFFGGDGVGFFGEDVAAVFQGGDGDFGVEEIGGADVYQIKIKFEKIVIVANAVLDGMRGGELVRFFLHDVADGCDFDFGMVEPGLSVERVPGDTCADDTEAKFLAHFLIHSMCL